MVTVGINGFGRIGRLVLRAALEESNINVVAVNDLGDINTMAHLFRYDSVHGKFNGTVQVQGNDIVINNKKVRYTSEKDPTHLPWKELNVDIVVESTGIFTSEDKLQLHIQAGAKKVLLSAPAKEGNVTTVVVGVNDQNAKGQ